MNNWIKKDLQYNWHPYTEIKGREAFPPILIERARGLKLYDAEGNFYYDTISSWWCNVHGHNHPAIKKAVVQQMDKLEHVLFAGFTHKSAILLAEKLVSIAPKNLARVFFSDDGSTAVETALKVSFQYWHNKGRRRKTKFVSLDLGYHGDTIGAMSVSGIGLFNKIFSPLLFESFKAPSPYCYRCPVSSRRETCVIECIKPLESILRKKAHEIAAIILEPMVMAAGGMIVYPKEYLKRAAELAKKYNVLLILDEVATAFGRTGRMFACEHAGVQPDLMCLSKGITAGYLPLGATLVSEEIYRAFKTFYHGHTYTANPIACSSALASLRIFEKENTLEKSRAMQELFHEELEKFKALSIVGDVRYMGLIGALELVRNKKTKEAFGLKERTGLKIYRKGLKRHLILRPLGNIIYLFLPLCIKRKDLEYILNTTYNIVISMESYA